jgi:[protein-PII] uridylyltransferase
MHQRLNKLLVQGKMAYTAGVSQPSDSELVEPSSSGRFHYVKEVRKMIEEKKGEIRERHKNGASGIEIAEVYTKLVDDLIIKMYEVVMDNPPLSPFTTSPSPHFKGGRGTHPVDVSGEVKGGIKGGLNGQPLALVPLGGYGRRELNPFSDVDILFLYERKLDPYIDFATHNIISMLWDIGFHVGHSTRAIDDCLSIAKRDITARTAMMESRYLIGSREVFDKFFTSFKRDVTKRGVDDFIKMKIEETGQRHSLYGNTVCVSEPNVKEGPGGLRDLHTALWAAMAKFGINTLEGLERRGIIDNQEKERSLRSLDFIFRVRNDMHFLSGKKNDVLSHEIQETVARNLGYRDGDLRGVIQFMKDYYTHASYFYHFSNSLIDRTLRYKPGLLKRIAYLKTREIGDGFVSIKDEIHVKDLNPDIFKKNPILILKIFLYCQEFSLTLGSSIKRLLNNSLALIDDNFIALPESKEILRKALKGKGVARVLRIMHDCGVLTRFLREFEHITFFSNYDFYHKFTVDEHTLRSIESLEALSGSGKDEIELRNIYKSISDKTALNAAVLMHDIGKGESSGHIQRGVEIASDVLKRWGMEEINDAVLILIGNHLLMNQIAQRRDMHDVKTIAEFCDTVKNVENLKMLYLLTYGDLNGVGPGVWTNWKSALMWELYLRGYEYFSRSEEERMYDKSAIDKKKREVLALIDNESDREIADKCFLSVSMPDKYILSTSPEKIARHIKLLRELDGKKLVIKYFHNMDVGYTELMVCTAGKAGVFSKIAGTITSKNINILGAQIYTRLDGIAVDTLQVSTVDGKPVLDEGMLQRFEQDLFQVLEGKKTVEELLSARQRVLVPQEKGGFKISTKIEIDNNISDTHTIIEVITRDRLGVLYDITRTLFNLELNIYIAKISTEGKTAIDVFYVTEINGGKILDEGSIEKIKDSLLKSLG